MLLQNVQDEFAEIIHAEEMHYELFLPVENMAIYRNNMLSSLTRTLMDTYGMIVKLVGKDFFGITAREYIRRYPSLSGNLHEYGEYFSDFLADYSPVTNMPYLAEVAKFEWICHVLYFANDANAFDIKALESVPPEQFQQIHFHLHPASRLVQFHYPILSIIDLCENRRDENIDLDEGGVNLLITRRGMDVLWLPLSEAEYTFLHALSRNEPLEQALDKTHEIDADFKLDLSLPKWIQDNIIVDFV